MMAMKSGTQWALRRHEEQRRAAESQSAALKGELQEQGATFRDIHEYLAAELRARALAVELLGSRLSAAHARIQHLETAAEVRHPMGRPHHALMHRQPRRG